MKWLLIILMSLAAFIQCRKDEIKPTPKKVRPGTKTVLVSSSVFGMITDQDGKGRAQVDVNIAGNITKTDDKGFFLIKDVLINEDGACVIVNSPGFFKSIRVLRPGFNETSSMLIECFQKKMKNSAAITASTSASVAIDGVVLNIPANNIVDLQGREVDDKVTAYIRWINLEKSTINTSFPSVFLGEDKDYALKSLHPYGMIAVELERQNGEALDFSGTTGVKARIPLPKTLVSSAPAFIPLWHFDEELARWEEKGEAKLTASGDAYECEIDQTGYWSLQTKAEPVQLSMRLLDPSGKAAGFMRVDIIDKDLEAFEGILSSNHTNDSGNLNTYIQADRTLLFKAYNDCDELVQEKQIGPFSAGRKADIGDYYLEEAPGKTSYTIRGKLYDCELNPVQGGILQLHSSSFPIAAWTGDDGSFTLSGYLCDKAPYLEVQGFEPDDDVYSASGYLLPENDIDLGPMIVCQSLPDTFVAVNVDGAWWNTAISDSYLWSIDSKELHWTVFFDDDKSITFQITDLNGPGNYTVKTDESVNFRLEWGNTSEIGRGVPDEAMIRIINLKNKMVTGVISSGLVRVYDAANMPIRDTRVDVFFKLLLP